MQWTTSLGEVSVKRGRRSELISYDRRAAWFPVMAAGSVPGVVALTDVDDADRHSFCVSLNWQKMPKDFQISVVIGYFIVPCERTAAVISSSTQFSVPGRVHTCPENFIMLSRTQALSIGAALRFLRGSAKPIPMFPGSFSWTLPTDIVLVAERRISLSIDTYEGGRSLHWRLLCYSCSHTITCGGRLWTLKVKACLLAGTICLRC
ncbi:hypothetical protein C8Q74DRAFT_734049 [Fomes fomentarius]|nr:hypothetical protein C8Q74DRAFT_734049 [Fomes fomentarius]